MSAYVVSNELIAAIVQRLVESGAPQYFFDGKWQTHTAEKLGQILTNENYRSVNYRYGEKKRPRRFKRVPTREMTPGQILGACNCLDYQSCETENWGQTEAYAILQSVKEVMIRQVPGYEWPSWS